MLDHTTWLTTKQRSVALERTTSQLALARNRQPASTRQPVFTTDDFHRRSSLRICEKRSADEYWFAHNFSGRLLDIMLPSRRPSVRLRKIDSFVPLNERVENSPPSVINGVTRERDRKTRFHRGPPGGSQSDTGSSTSEKGSKKGLKRASAAVKKTMVLHVPKVSVLASETECKDDVLPTSCRRKDEGDREAIKIEMSARDIAELKSYLIERKPVVRDLSSEKSEETHPEEGGNNSCSGSVARARSSDLEKETERMDKPEDRHFSEMVASPPTKAVSTSSAVDDLSACPLLSLRVEPCDLGRSPDRHDSSRPNYVQAVREQLKRFKNEWSDKEENFTDSSSPSQQSCGSIWPSVEVFNEKAKSPVSTVDKKTAEVPSLATSAKRKSERTADVNKEDSKKPKPSTALRPTVFTRRKASLAAEARSSIMTWIQNAPHSTILEDHMENSVFSCTSALSKQPTMTCEDRNIKRKPKKGRNAKLSKDAEENRENQQEKICIKEAAPALATDDGITTRSKHMQTASSRNLADVETTGQVTVVRVIKGASDDENELSGDETSTREPEVFQPSAEEHDVVEATVVTVSVEDPDEKEDSVCQQSDGNSKEDNEVFETAIESNLVSEEEPRARLGVSLDISSAPSPSVSEELKQHDDKSKPDNVDTTVKMESVINLKRRLRKTRKPPNRFSFSSYISWSKDDVQQSATSVTIKEESKELPSSGCSATSIVANQCEHTFVGGSTSRETRSLSSDFSSGSDSGALTAVGNLPHPPENKLSSCLSKAAQPLSTRKISDGWILQGQPTKAEIREGFVRHHYASAHKDGETITVGDYVLMRPPRVRVVRKYYVGKVKQLFKDDNAGEGSVVVAWFYRSTDLQIRSHVPVSGLGEMEVLKSRHRNENPVGAVKAKCHVLSFSQYCRFRANLKWNETLRRRRICRGKAATEVARNRPSVVVCKRSPNAVGGDASTDMLTWHPSRVFFCRYFYHYRSGTIKPFRFRLDSTTIQ